MADMSANSFSYGTQKRLEIGSVTLCLPCLPYCRATGLKISVREERILDSGKREATGNRKAAMGKTGERAR